MKKLKDLLKEIGLLVEAKGKGDCYQAAGMLVMDFFGEKAKLVHGMVNGRGALDGLRFGHAWVEVGSKALDHSNGNKFSVNKKAFYAMGGVKSNECHYYTPEESAKWMVTAKHWGPWEMSGDTIKLYQEDIPDDRGEIGIKRMRISNDVLDKLNTKLKEAKKT
jgi:hypothetical protein